MSRHHLTPFGRRLFGHFIAWDVYGSRRQTMETSPIFGVRLHVEPNNSDLWPNSAPLPKRWFRLLECKGRFLRLPSIRRAVVKGGEA